MTEKRLADELVLLVYCMGTLFFLTADIPFIAAFLTMVLFISLIFWIDHPLAVMLACLLFAAVCFVSAHLALFVPLLVYALFSFTIAPLMRGGIIAGLMLVSFALSPVGAAPWIFFVFGGSALALLLCRRNEGYETIRSRWLDLRDEKVERERLLEQRNRITLERQTAEIRAATLGERNRIAREIHDNVGHMLSRCIMMTGAMKSAPDKAFGASMLDEMENTLTEAMNEIRRSVHDLRDRSLQLESAIRQLQEDFTYCEVHLEYDCTDQMPGEVRICFLAIIKEALNNVMRHSNADSVHITVREHPGFYQLIMEDNGSGGSVQINSEGMGLANMKERIRSLGGTIQFLNNPGFLFHISVPRKDA